MEDSPISKNATPEEVRTRLRQMRLVARALSDFDNSPSTSQETAPLGEETEQHFKSDTEHLLEGDTSTQPLDEPPAQLPKRG